MAGEELILIIEVEKCTFALPAKTILLGSMSCLRTWLISALDWHENFTFNWSNEVKIHGHALQATSENNDKNE